MSDILVEFAADTARFKRSLDTIERDAKRTAVEIARSFREAEASGFGVDPRSARTQRLATEREINQRLEADRRTFNDRWIRDEHEARQRLEQRTRVYADRQAHAEREIKRSHLSMSRGAVMVGAAVGEVGAITAYARSAWRDYAQEHQWAASAFERSASAHRELRDEVGKTMALAGLYGDRAGSSALGWASNAFRSAQNWAMDTIHGAGTSTEMRGAFAAMEGLDRNMQVATTMRTESLALDLESARRSGDTARAQSIESRMAREAYGARLGLLASRGQLTNSEVAQLMARRDAMTSSQDASTDREALRDLSQRRISANALRMRATGNDRLADLIEARGSAALQIERLDPALSSSRRRQMIDAINAERDARIAAIEAEEARRRKLDEETRQRSLEAYRLRAEEAKADELSASGRRQEADALRVQIGLEREVLAIRMDRTINESDRAGLIEGARSRAASMLMGAFGRERGPVRSIGSGIGDGLLRRQVLGLGGHDVAKQQLDVSKQQLKRLDEIAEKTGVYA